MEKKTLIVVMIVAMLFGFGLGTWGTTYLLEPTINRQTDLIREQNETIKSLEDTIEQLLKNVPPTTTHEPTTIIV